MTFPAIRFPKLIAAMLIAAGTLAAGTASAAPMSHAGQGVHAAATANGALVEVRHRHGHNRPGARGRHHGPRWGQHHGPRGPRWGQHRGYRAQNCIRTQRVHTRFGYVVRQVNVCR